MQEDSQVDGVSLLTTAVVTAAWTALPDFVRGRSTRWWARAGLVAAGAVIVGVRQGHDPAQGWGSTGSAGDVAPDAVVGTANPVGAAGDDADGGRRGRTSPVVVAGLAAAGVGVTVAGLALGQRLDDEVAAAFDRRGVRYPYVATGLLWGILAPLVWLLPDGSGERAREGTGEAGPTARQ